MFNVQQIAPLTAGAMGAAAQGYGRPLPVRDAAAAAALGASYVDASGAVPVIDGSDTLEPGTFKVVVGSWRRMNATDSTPSDFAVAVSNYVPKAPFIRRVQLVDIDIPQTQQLIEPAWCRLYYGLGLGVSAACRNLDMTLRLADQATTASVVLPMRLDRMRTYMKLPPATVRVVMRHRAPAPIRSIAEAWTGLASRDCGGLALVGLAAFPAGYQLTRECVSDANVTSFDVTDAALYAALPDVVPPRDDPSLPVLVASPVPGPSFLATILSRSLVAALAAVGQHGWQATFAYSVVEDRFVFTAAAPAGSCYDDCCAPAGSSGSCVSQLTGQPAPAPRVPASATQVVQLSGYWSAYMGFGPALQLALPRGERLAMPASAPRAQLPTAFAAVAPGSPRSGPELAARVTAAMCTYDWGVAGFPITIAPPGMAPVTVHVPGGRMALPGIAAAITEVLAAAPTLAPLQLFATTPPPAPNTSSAAAMVGVVFGSQVKAVFGLDLSGTPPGIAVRLGYNAVAYPMLALHVPPLPAAHIPGMEPGCADAAGATGGPCDAVTEAAALDTRGCLMPAGSPAGVAVTPVTVTTIPCVSPPPPTCNVVVTYEPGAAVLQFACTPFGPNSGNAITALTVGGGALTDTYTVDTGAFRHGLHVGAGAVLTTDGTDQQAVVVVCVGSPTSLTVRRLGAAGASWPAGTPGVTLVPTDVSPLDLYMQRQYTETQTPATNRVAAIEPEVLGLPPATLERCRGSLLAPGSVCLVQDPYVLLCLAFSGGDGPAMTGDVFYPFYARGTSYLVFAKVPRSTACYRQDFDKVFDHVFAGAGQHLGIIRVRILNPNGTLYETHGHNVSITLRFDVRQSALALGGPGHTAVLRE